MNKFNNLTPAQEEQLYLLTEEASEVIQAVQKILRHGYDRCNPLKPEMNNRQDLEKELGHLYHAISRLNSKNEISLTRIANHCHKKEANIAPYLHHQEEGMA